MGKRAKRVISGGGTNRPSALGLTHMTSMVYLDGWTMLVTYSSTVTASQLQLSGFATTPSMVTSDSAYNYSPNQVAVKFGEEITGEAGIDWAGSVPGVLSPDHVDF